MAPMWTAPMHAQLVYGLRSYRDRRAAPVDEIRELDALIANGFQREQTRRRKFARHLERQRRVERSLVPMHVRNRELDAEIQRQRKARQDMRVRGGASNASIPRGKRSFPPPFEETTTIHAVASRDQSRE